MLGPGHSDPKDFSADLVLDNKRIAVEGLQLPGEHYKAREAANRPLLDVIEETVRQVKGMET